MRAFTKRTRKTSSKQLGKTSLSYFMNFNKKLNFLSINIIFLLFFKFFVENNELTQMEKKVILL